MNANWQPLPWSGPFGAVESSPAAQYAQTLAEQGFVTLAFDPSYIRAKRWWLPTQRGLLTRISIPDFSAAVDFLGLAKRWVDHNRIGFARHLWSGAVFPERDAAMDTRVKAVATKGNV